MEAKAHELYTLLEQFDRARIHYTLTRARAVRRSGTYALRKTMAVLRSRFE